MKILVADDSLTIRRIQKNFLAELGYTEIVEADCGEDVLVVLQDHPDTKLVLLDWNMPLMNGLDCLKAIKANPVTRHIPVVMVTAEVTKSRILEAIQCGASNYLMKPFESEKLREIVDGLLGTMEPA